MSADHKLALVDLDAATLPAATAEIEHERRVAQRERLGLGRVERHRQRSDDRAAVSG